MEKRDKKFLDILRVRNEKAKHKLSKGLKLIGPRVEPCQTPYSNQIRPKTHAKSFSNNKTALEISGVPSGLAPVVEPPSGFEGRHFEWALRSASVRATLI